MNSPVSKKSSASTGLNLLAFGDASREQMAIIRILLKRDNLTRAQLWQAAQEMPEEKRMSAEDFDAALLGLLSNKWLWRTGEGESATYSPRLRKKTGRGLRYQLSANHGVTSIASMWQMLDQRKSLEAEVSEAIHQAHETVADWVDDRVSGMTTERKVVMLMVFILLVGSFSISTLEIVGVSGFVETVGTQNLPWLSIVEMALGILTSGVFIQFADRLPRERLMQWTMTILAVAYALMAVLFVASQMLPAWGTIAAGMGFEKPQAVLFPLLYLMRSQQIILFPLSFWNLANSLYSMAEARKVFPVLASGGTIGGLLGYAMFTEFFNLPALFTSADSPLLLGVTALFFVLGFVMVRSILKEGHDADNAEEKPQTIIENLRDGIKNIREVPLFRYMAGVVIFTRVAFTIFVFHNVYTMSAEQASLASLLSIFGIVSAVLPLILQWQVVPFFSSRVETKDSFIVLPFVLVLGLGISGLMPDLLLPVVIGLLVSGSVASSWDYPMQNTLQNLIPEKRRAQVSTLLSNYSFAVGQISGAMLLLLAFTAAPWLGLPQSRLYLPVGFLSAMGAVVMAVQVRRTYTDSMLSWRVARRARSSSVLDKLD